MIKYGIVPGEIPSKYDGQIHYITAARLMSLYGVNPAECVTLDKAEEAKAIMRTDLIILKPRYDGDYTLPKEKQWTHRTDIPLNATEQKVLDIVRGTPGLNHSKIALLAGIKSNYSNNILTKLKNRGLIRNGWHCVDK